MAHKICMIAMFIAAFTSSGLSGALVPSNCPTYWTAFEGNCYRFFGQRVNMKEAQYNCRIHGSAGRFAYLVSIHSKEESDFLVTLFQSYTESSSDRHSHVWIGLSHEAGEGTFVWSDGTDTHFTNWGDGHPTVASSAQAVVLIHPNHGDNGRWHETSVMGNFRYICKMPMFKQ
ncbi:Alpha-N-acetylgalactosamine-specific lectin [Holothuria leucospilota]|uniref:Alpha-N-acetylgalactosamine-specific lectin n=1 Tax=Holothuria leucospilota TaxID=206669 RepID=A0A9Q1HAM7_HOLLE|nr:Alpha-N-acetylgalactosamine-specific lectin [Holothuria leucospilota]